MALNDFIYILIGVIISLLITYIVIIKKFNDFINSEISNNYVYRGQAEADYKAATGTSDNIESTTGGVDSNGWNTRLCSGGGR